MGSCSSKSAPCSQCASCKERAPSAAARGREPSLLSQAQRQRLETEADLMAERFTRSGFAGGGSRPTASAAPQQAVLKKDDEESPAPAQGAAQGSKGDGSVTETAESNLGEPGTAADAVLTKRADARVEPVSHAPSSIGGGSAMPSAERRPFENFFGRDFSAVRIHNDSQAHQYTRQINALAATRSNHIYLSERVASSSPRGLLAHELTHVVQQGRAPLAAARAAATVNTARIQDAPPNISPAPIGWQLYQATICSGRDNEHPSTQPLDFPETYISKINVSLTNQKVTLDWTGPSVAEAERNVLAATGDGVINCSTGAGVTGQPSCNDTEHSKSSGSCCTPKGTFTLGAQSCVTPRLGLENFSGFQRDGVGFHFFSPVPSHPASHGCVRLHRGASKIIFDSARSNVTTVEVSGSYTGAYARHSSCD